MIFGVEFNVFFIYDVKLSLLSETVFKKIDKVGWERILNSKKIDLSDDFWKHKRDRDESDTKSRAYIFRKVIYRNQSIQQKKNELNKFSSLNEFISHPQ